MGRHKRKLSELELTQTEKMAQLGMTDLDIADMLQISEATLQRRAAEQLKKGRCSLRKALLTAQLKSAIERGSHTMQIWLGKQYLGQQENPVVLKGKPSYTEIVLSKSGKVVIATKSEDDDGTNRD